MIERIIRWSVANRLVVIMLSAILAGWGAYAVVQTPVDAIPDIGEKQVIVYADWDSSQMGFPAGGQWLRIRNGQVDIIETTTSRARR